MEARQEDFEFLAPKESKQTIQDKTQTYTPKPNKGRGLSEGIQELVFFLNIAGFCILLSLMAYLCMALMPAFLAVPLAVGLAYFSLIGLKKLAKQLLYLLS